MESDVLKNHQGFVIVSALVLSAALVIGFAFFLNQLGTQQKVVAQNRSKAMRLNLVNSISMIFGDVAMCANNISAQNFGTSLSQLDSLSNQGKIQLQTAGGVTGPDAGIFLSTTKKFQNLLQVDKVFFANRSTINAATNSYVANLTVQITDTSAFNLRPVVIPFYLWTDASGTIQGCYATNYMDPDASAPSTIQDMVCHELIGTTKKFDPVLRECI
jgi:hypothetical protein